MERTPLRNPAACRDRCLACEPRAPGAVHAHRIAERTHRLQRPEGSKHRRRSSVWTCCGTSHGLSRIAAGFFRADHAGRRCRRSHDGERPTAPATTTRTARWDSARRSVGARCLSARRTHGDAHRAGDRWTCCARSNGYRLHTACAAKPDGRTDRRWHPHGERRPGVPERRPGINPDPVSSRA